jgi:hypothetical protein
VRCQRCHQVFTGDSASESKIDHERTCNVLPDNMTDERIDCVMLARLKHNLVRFRSWSLENWSPENTEHRDYRMSAWVSSCITALTGITRPRADLSQIDLYNLVSGERELAKWYTIWTILFPTLRIPDHPCELPPRTRNPHAHRFASLRP